MEERGEQVLCFKLLRLGPRILLLLAALHRNSDHIGQLHTVAFLDCLLNLFVFQCEFSRFADDRLAVEFAVEVDSLVRQVHLSLDYH